MAPAHRDALLDTVYPCGIATFGVFRLPPHDHRWTSVNHIGDAPIIVFPRVPVRIDQRDRGSLIADPSCAVLYNRHQPYLRQAISPRGDECEYIGLAPGVLEVALRDALHAPGRSTDRPFSTPCVPCAPRAYLSQRRLHDDLVGSDPAHRSLRAEETLVTLIAEALDADARRSGAQVTRRAQVGTERAHADLVERTKRHLLDRWAESPSIESVSRAVHASPFHLCRVFRTRTGYTLHAFLRAVRLGASLEHLADAPEDLARLALDLGFSSHAHFSACFRGAFGLTPAQARAEGLTRRRRREMSNRVIAAA